MDNEETRLCDNCGGKLVLDGAAKEYVCEYCASRTPADDSDPEYREYASRVANKAEKKKRGMLAVLLVIAACVLIGIVSQAVTALQQNQESVYRSHIAAGDIQVPASSGDFEGRDAQKVAHELIDAGFDRVDFVPGKDVSSVFNFHKNAGKVERISINGRSSFNKNEWFSHSAKISIQYHPKAFEDDYEPIVKTE